MTRLYSYVGPKEITQRVQTTTGTPIHSRDDIRRWAKETQQELVGGCVIATFVVDAEGTLCIADRRSEHVACAAGGQVQSAGEMTFEIAPTIDVVEVSNQSTGYCPEPESWPAVAAALKRAGFAPPEAFALACDFRRCIKCGNLTLVKDQYFRCICGHDLPAAYNVQ